MLPVEPPYKTYFGADGTPLQNGFVYFGLPNQNPITAPLAVYWDAAGTQVALQPLRTVNGYIYRSGTPANVFVAGEYSELVQDSSGAQVFYARTSDEFSVASSMLNLADELAAQQSELGGVVTGLVNTVNSALGAIGNFKTDRFFTWARVTDVFQPMLIVGDSISEGANATSFKLDSFASILRKAYQTRFKNRNVGFANFSLANAEIYPSTTKYTHEFNRTGFGLGPALGFTDNYYGGTVLKSQTIGDYVDIAYTGKDCFVVYGRDAANGGKLTVTLDGTVVGEIDTSLASQQVASSVLNGSFSAPIVAPAWGRHLIRLTVAQAKPVLLCGMFYVEDYTVKSPVVSNVGRSSIALCDIDDTLLTAYANGTGASILALGVNDRAYGRDINLYKSKIAAYLGNVASIKGACVICDFIFDAPTTDPYKTAMREGAAQFGFPYLDFARMWFGNSPSNTYAKMVDGDWVHPTDAGHEFIANEIMRVIGLQYDKSTAIGYTPAGAVELTPVDPWVALVPPSPYAEVGSPGVAVRRDALGMVHVSGVLTGGLVPAYTNIVQVPTGWRPRKTELFAVTANHVFGELEVSLDGWIKSGATAIEGPFSLSGISYKGEEI